MQRQVTGGAQYAVDLRVESFFIGYVHRAVLHPDRIETGIRMEHVERAGVTESDEISQVGAGGEHLPGATELLCDVQNLHRATDLGREGSRRTAQTTSHVEHPHLGCHTGQADQLQSRVLAASVELIYRG